MLNGYSCHPLKNLHVNQGTEKIPHESYGIQRENMTGKHKLIYSQGRTIANQVLASLPQKHSFVHRKEEVCNLLSYPTSARGKVYLKIEGWQ